MSWHYLLEGEEAYWPHTYLDGAPSALLKLTLTVEASCSPGSGMECSTPSRSGTTCEPSTERAGEDTSMSCPEDSLARTSPPPDQDAVSPESVPDCGPNSPESSGRSRRRTSSSKTLRTFVLADLSSSCKTLPVWGMMRGGVCWAQTPWVPPTSANDSGLLPTPTTRGNEMSLSMQKWPAHRRLMDLFENLPRPRASDADRGGSAGRTDKVRPSLETLTGGPWISFREWMMGWPIGWTALEPLAMAKFQQWQQWHGGSCPDE